MGCLSRMTMDGLETKNDKLPLVLAVRVSACVCKRRIYVGFMLLAFCLSGLAQGQDPVSVSTPQELRAALLANATQVLVTANMNFNTSNWPDPPVVITKQVTIFSLYRVKLDFCGISGDPARPLIVVTAPGSLLLQKLFLRNFLPSKPQNLSGLGPVPALLSTGGTISFRVVVFHFLPSVTWVFSAPPAESFWAREGRSVLTSVYTGAPVQLDDPALYLVTYTSPANVSAKYSMQICYAPMDLHGCYSDNGEDTTLIYCLYTFADSLRNPSVRHVRVFHDVGIDRVAYSRSKPIVVTQPKSYRACAGSRPSINMENLYGAVAIRDAVDFSGLRFKASLPTNYSFWPPNLPLLLSLFDVAGSGVVSLNDTVVDVPDFRSTAEELLSLPAHPTAVAVADPTQPNLRPVVDAWPAAPVLDVAEALATRPVTAGAFVVYDAWHPDGGMDGGASTGWPGLTIQHWVLEGNAWAQYAAGVLNAYEALSAPSAAAWRFDGVFVRQADNANARALCFAGALEQGSAMPGGVTVVRDELELRAALAAGKRYVQVVSDIKLSPGNWPGGDAALVLDAAIIEVRGCHPQYGQRYTIDLSDLVAVVRIRGQLALQGDLRFVNVGWTTIQPAQLLAVAAGASEVSTLGAFALAQNGQGVVMCEGILVDALYDPEGTFRPVDLLAVLHLNHMTPAIRAYNASLRGDDRGITLGFWAESQSNPPGTWVFTNTDIYWTPVNSSKTGSTASVPPGGDGGDGSGGSGGGGGGGSGGGGSGATLAIIIPCVVGGVVLLTVVPLAVMFLRRRSRRRAGLYGAANQSVDATAAAPASANCGKEDKGLSASIPGELAQAQSSGGDATDSDGASALAAVLQAAQKIISSGGISNGSASLTRTDMSGGAAGALAVSGRARCDRERERPPGKLDAPNSRNKGPWGDIDAAKREIVASRGMPDSGPGAALDDLVLQAVLGEGSYGRVYRALWRGTTVAVKVILLPAHMSGRERHERMAVMEAAISSSLSHPNIVQTYTYTVESVEGAKARALRLPGSRGGHSALPEASTCPGSPGGAPGGGGGGGGGAPISGAAREAGGEGAGDRDKDIMGYEIRLVQEFCDLGSLRDKLNSRAFFVPCPVSAGAPLSPPLSPSSQQQQQQQHLAPMMSSAGTPGRGGLPAVPTVPVITEEDGEVEADAESNSGGGGASLTPSDRDATCPSAAAPPGPRSATSRGAPGGGSLSEIGASGIEYGSAAAAAAGPGGAAACDGVVVGGGGGDQERAPLQIVDLAAVLDTAIDVARALAHLHREGIVHADLKPRNVLLKGSTTDPRGFVAKVADFGLSMRLDPHETHVSNAFHGTLAYMAPETLLHGHVSRPSDVYGFGILMYELYTGETAFRGVPKALIGHAVTKENLRPVFPPSLGAPFEYQLLACRCWESNPEIRPEFDFILEDLKRMRARLCASPHDEGSAGGGPSSQRPTGGPSVFTEPAVWGLPGLSQRPSMQGRGPRFEMNTHNPAAPGYHLRAGGGGFTDGDHSLSPSNSVTMSSIGVLTGPHNTASTIATACGGGGGGGVASAASARHVGAGAGAGMGTAAAASAPAPGGGTRTAPVPYPACLDPPLEVEDEEEASAAVRSL